MPSPVPDAVTLHEGHLIHPAFSLEQRRFERSHRQATTVRNVTLLGVEFRIADFKTTQIWKILAEELQSDPYELLRQKSKFQVNDRFLDIGANIGLVSMLLALMNPGSFVLAFEPVPELYRFLLWNLKLNQLTGSIWPVNAGVGAEGCKHVYYDTSLMAVYWLPRRVFS